MATLDQFVPSSKAEIWQAIADAKADAKVRANHIGPLNWAWAVYGGTANAITLAPAFARTAYVVGDEFRFRATATNTGATTINVGGLGVKAAVTVTGEVLPSGYIRTDVDTVCVYDGTQFVVQREIETGTNANGNYIKFADGTAMAWGYRLGYVAGDNYTPLPITFTGSCAASMSVIPYTAWQTPLGWYANNSQFVFNMPATNASNGYTFFILGRWK